MGWIKLIVWYKNGVSLLNKIEDATLLLMNVVAMLISGLGLLWDQTLSLLFGMEWTAGVEDRSWEEDGSYSLLCRAAEELAVG